MKKLITALMIGTVAMTSLPATASAPAKDREFVVEFFDQKADARCLWCSTRNIESVYQNDKIIAKWNTRKGANWTDSWEFGALTPELRSYTASKAIDDILTAALELASHNYNSLVHVDLRKTHARVWTEGERTAVVNVTTPEVKTFLKEISKFNSIRKDWEDTFEYILDRDELEWRDINRTLERGTGKPERNSDRHVRF